MADVCADLLDELQHDPGVRRLVEARVFAGRVPDTALPFIWMQRSGIESSGAMEAEDEPLKEMVDLECVSDDSAEALELSDAVRAALDGRRGLIGYHAYSWVGVLDASENYVPRNQDADEFLHVSSLKVEVYRP
jgi:hypothetical protein